LQRGERLKFRKEIKREDSTVRKVFSSSLGTYWQMKEDTGKTQNGKDLQSLSLPSQEAWLLP
jgi:hypothetical protein